MASTYQKEKKNYGKQAQDFGIVKNVTISSHIDFK